MTLVWSNIDLAKFIYHHHLSSSSLPGVWVPGTTTARPASSTKPLRSCCIERISLEDWDGCWPSGTTMIVFVIYWDDGNLVTIIVLYHYCWNFRELWSELMVKWPRSYWDDWMREPAQRKGSKISTKSPQDLEFDINFFQDVLVFVQRCLEQKLLAKSESPTGFSMRSTSNTSSSTTSLSPSPS